MPTDLALVDQSMIDRLEGDEQDCARIFDAAFADGDGERARRYFAAAQHIEQARAILMGSSTS